MAKFTLGSMAKEISKSRFRGFTLTLPGTSQGIRPTVRPVPGTVQQAAPPAMSIGKAVGGFQGPKIGGHRAAPPQATPMPFPPALFRSASNSKDDVDYQKGMHDMFNGLFDALLDAVEFGFNQYRVTASLVDVHINGPIATGGRLEGPALDSLIKAAPGVAGWSDWFGSVRDAVAGGMQQQWSIVAQSVRVPGLPWYPSFTAVPSPQAPPTPNVPTPFMVLAHAADATSASNLKIAMKVALRGNMDYSLEFFESLGAGLEPAFQMWKTTQMLTNVLGHGPVPTFAPPYVPVGPVAMGSILRGSHIAG